MYLQRISLLNFKNIQSQSFDFQRKINCFVGDNGVGKTNILDAIYYLSFTKSYFNSVAVQNITHGESFFMVEGDYLLNDRYENRFWKNSNSDTITFNLKYKGKIIPIVEGESIECNNSVDSLIRSLNQIKTQIELLDNSDILFSNIK